MTTIDSARLHWEQMIVDGAAQQMLIDSHPLHLYFGVGPDRAPVLLLISNVEPDLPPLGGLVSADTRRRLDGRWASPISLRDDRFSGTFIGMCLELARRTQSAATEHEALALFALTLRQWQKLLERKGARDLSDLEVRGLLAELSFASTTLTQFVSVAEVVNSWVGPLGAPQDFKHEVLGLIEVKSVRSNGTTIRVSSPAQLDPHPESKLHLSTVVIDSDPLGLSPTSRTLADAVEAFEHLIGTDHASLDLFRDRLAEIGLDTTDPRYSKWRYEVGQTLCFLVVGDFPRLRVSDIPLGVQEVTYAIRMEHLRDYEVPLESIQTNGGTRHGD